MIVDPVKSYINSGFRDLLDNILFNNISTSTYVIVTV